MTDTNPLSRVGKVKETRDIRRKRRPFTENELRSLLKVAPERRRQCYLIAAYTGLRRNELGNLIWGDVHLDNETPFIQLRAETTKNEKAELLAIHPELADELAKMRGAGKAPGERVVRMFAKMEPMKNDLKKAGIPFEDEQGRRVDFHALRHTFNARMASAGVPLAFAQRAMRHSEAHLTSVQYLDPQIQAISQAVAAIPRLFPTADNDPVSHIGSHDSVSEGLSVSQPVTEGEQLEVSEPVQGEGISHAEAQSVAPSHNSQNGSSGWIRTNDLVVNSHPLYR